MRVTVNFKDATNDYCHINVSKVEITDGKTKRTIADGELENFVLRDSIKVAGKSSNYTARPPCFVPKCDSCFFRGCCKNRV